MNRRLIEKLKLPESFRVPYFGGLYYRYCSKLDNRAVAKAEIPEQPLNTQPREKLVTATMTSFPARIEYVHLAIKTLMLQSYKPDRIILWLANEQFPEHKLPQSLLDLEKYGLEIKWCDDLYGHKRYYYCIKAQKENEVVITFDDDILYPIDCIKRLMEKHREYPQCIICERAQARKNAKAVNIDNPGRWAVISNVGCKTPSYGLNPSPGGGCLIPYGAFYKDAYDEEKIRELAYKADDLWYMFMAAENGTKIVKTRKYHRIFSLISGSQAVQIATENVVGNKNVDYLARLAKEYPTAFNRIIEDKD